MTMQRTAPTAVRTGFQDTVVDSLSAQDIIERFGVLHLDNAFDAELSTVIINELDACIQKLVQYLVEAEDPVRTVLLHVDSIEISINHHLGMTQIIYAWDFMPEDDFFEKALLDTTGNVPVVKRDRLQIIGGDAVAGGLALPEMDAEFYNLLSNIYKMTSSLKRSIDPVAKTESLALARYEPGAGIAQAQGRDRHIDGLLNEVVRTFTLKGKVAADVGIDDDLTKLVRAAGQGTLLNDSQHLGFAKYQPVHNFYNPFDVPTLSLVMDHHGIHGKRILEDLGITLPDLGLVRSLGPIKS